MKKLLSLIALAGCLQLLAFAQPTPMRIAKNANRFQYHIYDYGASIDTSTMEIVLNYPVYQIVSEEEEGPFVPGYAKESTLVNLKMDSCFMRAAFTDKATADNYEVVSPFSRNDIHFDTSKVNGLTCYTCHINSNKLEFFVQDYPYDLNPIPYYGRFKGLLVCFKRNNQIYLQLAHNSFDKNVNKINAVNTAPGDFKRVTGRELSTIKKQKLIITTRIFDDEQICWGKTNSHIENAHWGNLDIIPKDSVMHFAGGTLILKRVSLPILPRHYQTFIELHQRSNGDAYDRTGSVFVIPQGYFGQTFFDGINYHPDSLPIISGHNGQNYQGIAMKRWTEGEWVLRYHPPVELMRFFTPFGVGHFNDRFKLDDVDWADETYYKQEVTDLSGYIQGDVLIGVWIGNYDGGGHKVTLDIKSYPGSDRWDSSSSVGDDEICRSLFNTCNVLEMAGQNYGKIFGSDSLTVTVNIPEAKSVKLRYISTGHGGWDGGDEFNPKTNTILIDGKAAFTYTPWREDCGCYRRFNPVSGNFWNGMSSSDYSRSGWCPGTATQPVYFDLSHLKPGKHTITVAIPMGEPQAGSFSHWAVSGVLIVNND